MPDLAPADETTRNLDPLLKQLLGADSSRGRDRDVDQIRSRSGMSRAAAQTYVESVGGKEDRVGTAPKHLHDFRVGNVQILTATQGNMSAGKAALGAFMVFIGFALPSLLLMTLTTVVATPIVVRRALTGLDAAADQARRIDIDKRGARLPLEDVPAEVVLLVKAVNDALARLDEGYARHKRFAADAAHELRTPIAILSTRLESLPQSPDKIRLTEDAARLAREVRLELCGQSLRALVADLSVACGTPRHRAPLRPMRASFL